MANPGASRLDLLWETDGGFGGVGPIPLNRTLVVVVILITDDSASTNVDG